MDGDIIIRYHKKRPFPFDRASNKNTRSLGASLAVHAPFPRREGATLLVGAASGECELEPALSWANVVGHTKIDHDQRTDYQIHPTIERTCTGDALSLWHR